ncbi:anti-sigma factor [Alkalicoccobacillus porphyridii]|nr:anti-sigma factor [Alkalicoccobacillus porphyridii]
MNNNKCIQLLDYFNGHLSKSEEEEFELHLLDCEECQEQLQELYEFNDQVADIPTDATPPAGMKDRILTSVFEEDTTSDSKVTPITKPDPVPFVNKKNKLMPWLAATAAVLAAAIGTNIYTYNQLNETQSQLTIIETERDIINHELERYVNAEPDPSTPSGIEQVITSTSLLSLENEDEHLGQASIVQQEDGYKLIVQVEQLPELTDSEVYQIWLFQEETPLPAGSFVTNAAGEGAIIYDLDSDTNIEDLFEAIAISLEPQPDNQEPEGPVLTLSELY